MQPFVIQPAKPSGAVRVLAVAGGVLALLLGSVLSLGMGLVALLGFGVTALVWRARNARLTRRASWIGAVLAVTFSSGAFISWGMSRAPGGAMATIEQSMDQAERQPPPPIVQRLQKLQPPPDPRVQRRMDSLTRSKPFLWWTMVMGFTFACLFFGLVVGTPAWGCAMLIGYGIRGRWPMSRPSPAASAG
ncbi:MAG: hypothetical protein ACJ8J0_09785 [Longimicrobiaceae bacterium]